MKSTDTTLAILIVLGIFVVIPLAIGAAIVGIVILRNRRAVRSKRAKAVGQAAAEPTHESVEVK